MSGGTKSLLKEALDCFRKIRAEDTHKGDYGRVLVIAGSEGMTGAAALCARAALHMGAGLVYMAAPRGLMPVYEILVPEAVKCPVGSKDDLFFKEVHMAELLRLSFGKDSVVLGPGLGSRPETKRLVRALLADEDSGFARDASAVILDADGLNAWAHYLPELVNVGLHRTRRMILTPHEGEMARLTGLDVDWIHRNREQSAADLSDKLSGAAVLLKGHCTVCAGPEGISVNSTGNPGMATGGSGDVLAGMIAGLAATERDSLSVLRLAAYGAALHGYCGDLAARKYGARFVSAGLLIEEMGALCRDDG